MQTISKKKAIRNFRRAITNKLLIFIKKYNSLYTRHYCILIILFQIHLKKKRNFNNFKSNVIIIWHNVNLCNKNMRIP